MRRLNDLVYYASTTFRHTIMRLHQLLALCYHYRVSDQVFDKCCDETVAFKFTLSCFLVRPTHDKPDMQILM